MKGVQKRKKACLGLLVIAKWALHFTCKVRDVVSLVQMIETNVKHFFNTEMKGKKNRNEFWYCHVSMRRLKDILFSSRETIVYCSPHWPNGPGELDSIPVRVIPKALKIVLDTSLLNTQRHKVCIKGKVEQPRKGVAPSSTPRCSSYSKGSLLVALAFSRQLCNLQLTMTLKLKLAYFKN